MSQCDILKISDNEVEFITGEKDYVLQENNLEEMLKFANAAAYLVTTRKGAIKSMPESCNHYQDIEKKTRC